MFGISFSELFVIAIVALLVIGPEKLPKVARTIGALTGRMQRYATQVKEEVNREFRFEELQKLQEEIKQAVINTEQNVQQQVAKVESSIAGLNEAKIALDQDAIQKQEPTHKPRAKTGKTVSKDLEKTPEHVSDASARIEKKSTPKVVKETKNLTKKAES
ncbi:MAG: Sec-independent protein translocase protein TatB [Pseudomonadota bacterium]